MASQAPTPIQSAISAELERELREIQTSSHTGPPGDLDDKKKRWLVVGICLHSILSPCLRKYVDSVVTNLYNALKLSDQIDIQTQSKHLRTYGTANIYLNYEAINNNKTTHGYCTALYDYKVQNAVDLSKLFLQNYMGHYTAFDGACDSSALLGMINKIDKFPSTVQTAANDVRCTIRNVWAHCNFTVWDDVKYVQSLQLVENFIYLLNLNAADKKQMQEELDKWRKNGTSFLEGYTISFELVTEIRQKIEILVEYAEVISKTADKEFGKVQDALIDIGETLSQYEKRISTLENTVAVQGKAFKEYGSIYDSDFLEIKQWQQDSKYFIKTEIVPDIVSILEDKHCVLLTGVSGIGKTLTAHNMALQLCHEHRYSIVPCMSLQDIPTRYKGNVRQVFVVDDICGTYRANIDIIENWRKIANRIKSILDKGMTKILATCRTEVFKENKFQQAFDLLHKNAYNLSDKYSFKDKLVIASKYLEHNDQMLPDITDIINKNKFSPLMCFLCSRHKKFDINKFLNSPFDTFCKEWDNLKSFDTEKFCVLLLCVIYNGTIDSGILDISNDLEKDIKKKLKDIFEWCSLNRGTSRSAIQAKINVCIDTYFIKVDREYKVIHDKMFDFLCSYFGKTLLTPILKYADDKVICERVQLESLHEAHGYFTIMVSEDDEEKYNQRIKTDLENGKIHCCLNNAQMKYKEYRIKFRDIIKNLEYNLIKNLINRKDDNGINSFIISCLRGYEELVAFFISVGADVDCQNGFFTPLTAACRDGHLGTVEVLLDKGSNVNYSNIDGETPLYTACICGHYGLVKRLIERSADIKIQNKYFRTPLYVSCLNGYENIVRILINEGATIYDCSNSLIGATLGGHDKIVEILITEDCDVNSVDEQKRTALFIACEEGYTKIVKLLIDNNVDIYKVNSDGETPLHAACCVGNNVIVSMLISSDSDVNMLDVDLETPLHKACRKGALGVIQTLLDSGADINKTNKDEHTPVYLAKTEGTIVDELILKALRDEQKGPTEGQILIDSKNEFQKQKTVFSSNWTPLYEACVHGDVGNVQSLIRNRAKVNMKINSGEMPLIAACQQGHGFLIQVLQDDGADVNEALCCAVQKDYDRTIKILLHKGGNVGYKGIDGKSLMTLACKEGSIKAIKILLEKGADFNEIDVNGKTLLHAACHTDSVELLQLLINKGLDFTIHDKKGRFPLFVSMNKGFHDSTKLLIKKRCPVAISDEDTKKALMSVFESGNNELSKLLFATGYTEKLSHLNETVLYHAYRLGLRENVEILRRNGADINKNYKNGYTSMILADIGGNDDLSEFLQNSICGIRNSNNSKGLVYPSYKEYQKRFNCITPNHIYTNVTNDPWSVQECEYLFQACMYGEMNLDKFVQLLRGNRLNFFIKPIEPHVPIWFEQTPLCLAIRRGHTEVVKFLIKHGVDVNLTFEENGIKDDALLSITIRYGYTPLFAACQRNYYEIVDMLLERRADLNKALYDACREGYLDTVQFLLQKGAHVNSICRFGQTALYAACIGGYSTIIKFLIDQGSFIDKKVQRASILDEPTCLHAAYLSDNHKTVQLLINRGASLDTVDNFGRTLLNKACKDGNYQIVEILIDKGVDINASDLHGSTPLIACVLQSIEDNHEKHYFDRHMRKYNLYNDFYQLHADYAYRLYAYRVHCGLEYKHLSENHYKVIQLLIENGADINKANKKGRTPLHLAGKIGDMKLTGILLHKVISD